RSSSQELHSSTSVPILMIHGQRLLGACSLQEYDSGTCSEQSNGTPHPVQNDSAEDRTDRRLSTRNLFSGVTVRGSVVGKQTEEQ
ncbi:hypothetical protein GBF38_013790, partial [Nibea albiflora]